jgi:hypothetical protein
MAEAAKKLIQIESADFMLGEKPYSIPAAGLARSEQWRKLFQEQVTTFLDLFKAQGVDVQKIDLGSLDLNNIDIAEWLPALTLLFVQLNVSMDGLAGLIIAYHPRLKEDLDYIQENATIKQAIVAVWEIVQLEYPFGSIIPKKESSPNGLADDTTLTNLQSLSGAFTPPK